MPASLAAAFQLVNDLDLVIYRPDCGMEFGNAYLALSSIQSADPMLDPTLAEVYGLRHGRARASTTWSAYFSPTPRQARSWWSQSIVLFLSLRVAVIALSFPCPHDSVIYHRPLMCYVRVLLPWDRVQHNFFRLLIPQSDITPTRFRRCFAVCALSLIGVLVLHGTYFAFKFHRFNCKLLSQLLSVRCSHIVCLHFVLLMSMVYLRGRLWKLHARELRAFNLALLYLLPFLLIHPFTTHATCLLFVFCILCIWLALTWSTKNGQFCIFRVFALPRLPLGSSGVVCLCLCPKMMSDGQYYGRLSSRDTLVTRVSTWDTDWIEINLAS
jgi:hypothetical protein